MMSDGDDVEPVASRSHSSMGIEARKPRALLTTGCVEGRREPRDSAARW